MRLLLYPLNSKLSSNFIHPLLEDLYFLQKPVILLMSSIISAGQVGSAVVLGWFGDHYGIDRALVASFALIVVGVFLLGFPTFSLFLPLAAFLIGARQVTVSLSNSIVAKYSLVNLRGTIFGFYMALMGIGQTCEPYIGGVLYEYSPTQPFLWTGISLTLLSFLVVTWNSLASER